MVVRKSDRMNVALPDPVVKPHGRATYEDVLNAPPHMVAEVADGTLHLQARPASPHARASSSIGAFIGGPFDHYPEGPGGWWIIDEPELHLGAEGEDILVPDVAGWRRENMPELPEVAYFLAVPDWVCEVLSPGTRSFDLGAKRTIYAREQVKHLWLIDPGTRTLEAFELHKGQWILLGTLVDTGSVSLPPFDATSFPLEALWLRGATA